MIFLCYLALHCWTELFSEGSRVVLPKVLTLAKYTVVCHLAGWRIFQFLRKLLSFGFVLFHISSHSIHLEDGGLVYSVSNAFFEVYGCMQTFKQVLWILFWQHYSSVIFCIVCTIAELQIYLFTYLVFNGGTEAYRILWTKFCNVQKLHIGTVGSLTYIQLLSFIYTHVHVNTHTHNSK